MVFRDDTTKLGLLQHCETTLFGDNAYGRITGDTNLLYQFTARINRAQDRFVYLAMSADGRWQYDDTNYTDYGIATTNIVSGQRDYTLAVTHLEIEKVLILPSATSSNYELIKPMDQDDSDATGYLENTSSNVGTPVRYDKRANSIFFDPTPNYNATAGLKIYFKRGPSYFTYDDTSDVPGFASIFHDYLSLHACRDYAIERNLSNAKSLDELVQRKEQSILDFFSKRNRDEVTVMENEPICKE